MPGEKPTKKTYEKLAKSGKEATFTCVFVVHVYLLCWRTYAWHLGALLYSRFHSVQVSLLGTAWFFQLLGKRKRFSCISFSSTGGVFAVFSFQPSWSFWYFTPPAPRPTASGLRVWMVFVVNVFRFVSPNKNSQPTHRIAVRTEKYTNLAFYLHLLRPPLNSHSKVCGGCKCFGGAEIELIMAAHFTTHSLDFGQVKGVVQPIQPAARFAHFAVRSWLWIEIEWNRSKCHRNRIEFFLNGDLVYYTFSRVICSPHRPTTFYPICGFYLWVAGPHPFPVSDLTGPDEGLFKFNFRYNLSICCIWEMYYYLYVNHWKSCVYKLGWETRSRKYIFKQIGNEASHSQ